MQDIDNKLEVLKRGESGTWKDNLTDNVFLFYPFKLNYKGPDEELGKLVECILANIIGQADNAHASFLRCLFQTMW